MSDIVIPDQLSFNEQGLIPTVVQDAESRRVLMVAYSNAESLRSSQAEHEAWFWSRSRKCLWHKGETSGHILRIREIRVDCDADTLLMLVDPAGPACHTGAESCFYRLLETIQGDQPCR
jgi:phosphoribosyl-AMP cyclohydrolase